MIDSPLTLTRIFLGIGLGGFFDGIVLHQILQWPYMLRDVKPLTNRPNIVLNILGDGLFHVFDLLMRFLLPSRLSDFL